METECCLIKKKKCEKTSDRNRGSMASETPMRIVDGGGAGKWAPAPPRGSAAFAKSATARVVTDELGLLLGESNVIDVDRSSIDSNRSGSAPPSMEGSFAAFGSNWGLPSIDGHGGGAYVYMPGGYLSTHEEEPEDDRSPNRASGDRTESNTGIMPGQNMLSFNSRHKSLVDLIQEDFPRTPSPVFNQNRSSSHAEEPFHHDMESLSLESQSPRQPESRSGVGTYTAKTDVSLESTGAKDPSGNSARPFYPQKDNLTSDGAYFASDFVSGDPVGSAASNSLQKLSDYQENQGLGFDEQNELQYLQHTYSQHVPGGYHVPMSHVPANNSSMIPHASLYAPPNAAYMATGNSIYPNFNSSGLYPQYGGGYAMGSTYLPPYLAGYPPQTGGYPPYQSFSGQGAGIPTRESVSEGPVMQNLNRFYGQQHGLTMHPTTFPDPLSLQYFQQTVQNPYGVPVQYSNLPSPARINNQVDYPTTAPAYSDDQKYQLPASGSVGFPGAGKLGAPSNSYLSSPTGIVPQFPASPFGSPVMPQSPVGGGSSGRRYDFGFSQSSPRSAGGYGRWKGQMVDDRTNDYRKLSFLEDPKANSARRVDLSEVVGRIVEFSIDQHGSRFIQNKLENCTVEEKESVFEEILPHCSKLITDVFGNYVIQKFFERGTCEQRRKLASQLSGQMLHLSLQMYGCRVIQKALEVIEDEQKSELALELDGHVMKCVWDQNGNHVLQKCIECLPTEKNDFIISAFKGQVAMLSTHPYGCRVIQRILEHCSNVLRCPSIIDEILESTYDLAHDQYGNYVTQHILERGKPLERSQIISKVYGNIVNMSHHKYASNVVEKCLGFGDAAERQLLIEEILLQSQDNNDNLLAMMKDQFANYVVQKVLEISEGGQREILLDRIQLHLDALKKYTYGKHIVARFEQLRGEDNDGTYEA